MSIHVEPVLDKGFFERIHDFYCAPRDGAEAEGRSIYEIWEAGGALNDSVTPSTYCPEYRSHMGLKILSLTDPGDRIFSIGCGNAFVEADLAADNRPVQAIDCNPEAAELATAKGVEAFAADFFALEPGHLAPFRAVYADGLLGHVYRPDTGLHRFFAALARLTPAPGSWLVFSNDAPVEAGAPVQPHPRVADFWLISLPYLNDVLRQAGYAIRESYFFPYRRPISGLRNRTICVAQVPVSASETGAPAGG